MVQLRKSMHELISVYDVVKIIETTKRLYQRPSMQSSVIRRERKTGTTHAPSRMFDMVQLRVSMHTS